jgi:hypothetical protein
MYSTRWNAAFSYGQARIELRSGWRVRPYLSARLVGDSAFFDTQSLSERSVILAIGATTPAWRGARAWFEAGNAIGYASHRMRPDYRGGLAFGRSYRAFADSSIDAIYVSRLDKDFIFYDQNRFGRIAGPLQFYWNANLTVDARRQYWANFVETGPGLRIQLLPGAYFTANLLRGAYLINRDNPRRPNFTDLRGGFWYAFSR